MKSIVSVLKIGKNVYDRNLLKQTLTFINEFNNNTIGNEKIYKYKELIETNPKKAEEELGRVLLLLNGYIDREKSIMLSKIFKAYVAKEIGWIEFCEFSEIINRLFVQDINVLRMIYQGTISDTTNRNDMFRVERLNSIGIIGLSMKSISMRAKSS